MDAPTRKSKAWVSSDGNLLVEDNGGPNEPRYERALRKKARKRKGEDSVVWCPYGNLAGF